MTEGPGSDAAATIETKVESLDVAPVEKASPSPSVTSVSDAPIPTYPCIPVSHGYGFPSNPFAVSDVTSMTQASRPIQALLGSLMPTSPVSDWALAVTSLHSEVLALREMLTGHERTIDILHGEIFLLRKSLLVAQASQYAPRNEGIMIGPKPTEGFSIASSSAMAASPFGFSPTPNTAFKVPSPKASGSVVKPGASQASAPPPSAILGTHKSPTNNDLKRKWNRISPEPVCAGCGTRDTPRWRLGANRSRVCNACGLLFRKMQLASKAQGVPMPATNIPILKRRKKTNSISALLNVAMMEPSHLKPCKV
eukprot:GILK01001402.1.p1 GENE.GILK01001402.1~~GILK01001402.1.p1  ORF type:complete len:332 (-),score=37.93 GILK01001402.1:394-1323(-)